MIDIIWNRINNHSEEFFLQIRGKGFAYFSLNGINLKIVFLTLLLLLSSCSKANNESPISQTHPAYEFHQIAKSGPTNLTTCESYGGKEIYPNDYERIKSLAQGVFTIKQIPTGRKFLAVSFGEGKVITTIKACCWEL